MSQQYLYFTLGPVQGFVGQARRTRDFWAGSFLLSWLTARAIKSVLDAGGEIVMPSVANDTLLARVCAAGGDGPSVGSLPNNFIASVPQSFDGNIVTEAVQKAWQSLADAVWIKDSLDEAGVSKELWDKQITSFWEIAWVHSGSNDAGVLAQRKNWRSYMPPESLGDKCTMMGEWQELSGATRPNPGQQRKFWSNIKKIAGISDVEMRENERLCAIAYVKRRFVHAWQELEGHTGWKLPTSVPSTSYMAAVHWLEQLIAAEPSEEATLAFCKKASSGERLTRIACISETLKHHGAAHLKKLADVDGRALFESDRKEDDSVNAARKAMLDTVPKLAAPLSPFYAILLMDGDNLGKTKEALGDATKLSEALALFTKEVPDIVKRNNGFLIYAGGDDVLAILPLEDAMDCALECRNAYMEIFRDKNVEAGCYSISAAIEYAHMKLPLTMILKDAHKLLDDVAKDRTGRDALACRVWKPGGVQQTWAMPWDRAVKGDVVVLDELAKKLGEDEAGEPGYAGKLLFNIRKTLEMIQGASQITNEAVQKMLVADYVSSGLLDGIKGRAAKEAKAKELIEPLLTQCVEIKKRHATGRYTADAALLMRFLAQKGVER